MASTSALRTQQTTSAQANNGQPWSVEEASTEVLANALAGLTVGASTAAATPGSDATVAFAVQGVTGGKAVAVADAPLAVLIGEVQATPTVNTLLRRLKDILSLVVLATGTNTIGKVEIAQTTPGLTNGVQPKQYAGVTSSFSIQTADQTVFTLAAGEVGFIQNLSADAPLAVKKGASASTSSLNFILAASVAASDGSGGAVKIDDWVGVVSVAKMTGTASYLAWKQAAA